MNRSIKGAWVANAASLAFLFVSGCFLQRGAIVSDGGPTDAFIPEDGDLADAGIDSGLIMVDAGDAGFDPDAGTDGGTDAGMMPDGGSDAGADPDAGTDGGTDAGMMPDGGMYDSCSDEPGICFRLINTSATPRVEGWMVNVGWELMDGSTMFSGWVSAGCSPGGVRHVTTLHTECRYGMPTEPATAVAADVYAYPVTTGGAALCSASSCPNFPAGYTTWWNMVEETVTQESMGGTPVGRIFVTRVHLAPL